MLKGKNFISFQDLSGDQIRQLLARSADLKKKMNAKEIYRPLEGTRTRVSTETGIAYLGTSDEETCTQPLGGHALFLSSQDIQLGQNETLKDTAMALSRFNDIILARVYGHSDILELVQHATVPVINALSDKSHPLQILADLLTIEEKFGKLSGLTIAWVGDGNNVLHSFMEACPKLGMNLRIATPPGYKPDEDITAYAQRESANSGTELFLTADPIEAVKGAHIIVTDTWISMGQETEKAERLKAFVGYQVTFELAKHADPEWRFMHCLPRKQEEVNDEVFYSDRSIVWDEAENRMYTVMAVALELLGK